MTGEDQSTRERVINLLRESIRQPIEFNRAVQEEWMRALELQPISAADLAGEYVKLTRATLSYQFELVNESRKLTMGFARDLTAPLRNAFKSS